jgi:hypothetical protein
VAVLLIVILVVISIANAMLFAGLYFLSGGVLRLLVGVFAPNKSGWQPRWWAGVALAATIMVVVPILLNLIRHHERITLVDEDKTWEGSFSNVGAVALLSDRLEDNTFEPAWRLCEPHRCKGLLYGNRAKAFLTGSPPPVGTPLDPTLMVMRYRIEHREWCPPLEHTEDRRDGRNLAELVKLAAGECLVGEPATLADADIVVVDQPLDPPRRPAYHTVHEAMSGERLSLHRRDGSGWRELSRQTEVGGSDWFVPMLIGPLDRNVFGAMMFGGGLIGFATSNITEAKPIDLDGQLKRWNLSSVDAPAPAETEMAPLARKILADPALPSASAAMQFLATYVWSDGWNGKNRALQAAIIRDSRVTDFSFAPSQKVTPREFAEPILDRIADTNLSEMADQKRLEANRAAVTRLAHVFSLLPSCTAAPMQSALRTIARDDVRRPYAGAIFSRLADAGPGAVEDFEYLLKTSLAAVGHFKYHWEWEKTEGQVVIAALEGLVKLGPSGKAAAPEVVAILKDKAAMFEFELAIPREMPGAGMSALISMGEIETLRSLYADTWEASLVEARLRQWKPPADDQCQG